MSDTIPPLYSSSPPPLTKSNFVDDGDSEEDEDDDDDEYGKFEEYSAVYNHTCEEILNNSPRKLVKPETKVSLSSSDAITGKDITDLPNNFHSAIELNSSSVPISSDILHSKTSAESINRKTLENNSISIDSTPLDSAINLSDTESIVNKDNVVCKTSKPSLEPVNFLSHEVPVTIGNSINRSESIADRNLSTGTEGVDSCDFNSKDANIGARLDFTVPAGKDSSSINTVGVSILAVNCSNSISVVDGALNDDDFEFDEFQSFSEQASSNGGFSCVDEKPELVSNFNSFASAEDTLSVDALSAQSETNHEHVGNGTIFPVTSSNFESLNDRISDSSVFKKSESSTVVRLDDSCQTSDVKNAVQNNTNDLSNGFSIFENSTPSSVTTLEANFNRFDSSSEKVALESNQITEDIIKAKNKRGECFELNSKSAVVERTDKISPEFLGSNEDDGFGDFEFADVPPGSTSDRLPDNAQSQSALLSDDDFCDFESAQRESKQGGIEERLFSETESNLQGSPAFETIFSSFASRDVADEDDDFSDFKSTNVGDQISLSGSNLGTAESSTRSEDDFGGFKTSFSKTPADVTVASSSKFEDDAEEEFDDFADFSTYDQASGSSSHSFDPAAAQERSKFWIEIFPPVEETVREIDVVSLSDLIVASRIWTKLRDLETTPALSFEWSKSTAYNKLLSSLNIDARNVFGLHWKSNVPRFAANLGCAPLEPSKAAEDFTSKPIFDQSAGPSLSSQLEVVPAAHFDWISSGLVNPLDGSYSTLLDINLLDTFVSCESAKKKETPAKEAPQLKAKDEAIDAEVQEFLQSLPDLSFMLVSHIQFPMNPTNPDKPS